DVYLEVHHIKPREEGGPTVLCNLVLLCWDHHEDLHERGWSVLGDAGPNMTWVRPDGTIYEPRVRVTLDTS
ncbi:MAG: HNH endonuclease signature motif containing protein, partial [Actinomycetota bacterium]